MKVTSVVPAQDAQGVRWIFALGTDGALLYRTETGNRDRWSEWKTTGFSARSFDVGVERDGRLRIVAAGLDHAMFGVAQLEGEDRWSGWRPLGGHLRNIRLHPSAQGALLAAGIATDETVWMRYVDATDASWTGHGGRVSQIELTRNARGCVELYGVGPDRALWLRRETGSAGTWEAWQSLGGWVQLIAPGDGRDGSVEVFAVGGDGALWHIEQSTPESAWSAWRNFGGNLKSVSVSSDKDGRIEIATIGSDDALWLLSQSQPRGAFSPWKSLGGRFVEVRSWIDRLQRIHLFGVTADGVLHCCWLDPERKTWSNWGTFPEGMSPSRSLGGGPLRATSAALQDAVLSLSGTGTPSAPATTPAPVAPASTTGGSAPAPSTPPGNSPATSPSGPFSGTSSWGLNLSQAPLPAPPAKENTRAEEPLPPPPPAAQVAPTPATPAPTPAPAPAASAEASSSSSAEKQEPRAPRVVVDVTDLPPGTIFAKQFKVESLLGRGGMGAVYVVEQLSTARKRALKVILPHLLSNTSMLKRFIDEARVTAQIESEHVVEAIDAQVDNDTRVPWLAMELLQGETLTEAVTKDLGRVRKHARVLFEQLGHGVGAAHRVGVVHRDLKPDNVYLAKARQAGIPFLVKVLDFGIAKVLSENREAAKGTQAMGSPLWMAPEQCSSGQLISGATDVWALGLIAFYSLTGKEFWKGAHDENASLASITLEVLVHEIPKPTDRAKELNISTELPAGFDAWFARCVVRDLKARFKDADEAIENLLQTVAL